MVPSLSIPSPKFGGSEEAISRFIRDANLHPLPEVVMPICSGPSVYVVSSVKEQRLGVSVTLTGIRSRWQSLDMVVAR